MAHCCLELGRTIPGIQGIGPGLLAQFLTLPIKYQRQVGVIGMIEAEQLLHQLRRRRKRLSTLVTKFTNGSLIGHTLQNFGKLREPVVRYGPFVMNTEQEIRDAFRDFKEGRF